MDDAVDENDPVQPRWQRRTVVAGLLAAATVPTIGPARLGQAQRRHVSPEDFGAIGDGAADNSAAFRAACRHCAATSDHLRLSRRRYRGARIEVHGSFDVIGDGATVDYLGVGNTLIEGTGRSRDAVPTPWPATDHDAYAGQFPVRQHRLVRDVRRGATTFTLGGAESLRGGDWLFLAQRPTSMSSGGRPGNYIPSDFAFARVQSVRGVQVTTEEPLTDDFVAGAAAFTSAGIATNCRISDLTIATNVDAYQHVLRSGVDITFERITFAGQSAVGAATFADRVTYRDCRVLGAYAALSVARGCGHVLIDGLTFATRRTTAEPFAIFLEESFRHVDIRNVRSEGAGFSIRSTEMGQASRRGSVSIDRCRFDTETATQGATGAFQGGVAIGLDIDVTNSVFRGSAILPDGHLFPGITQRALTWMASIAATDRLSFTDCRFESVNGGAAFAGGTGFQGLLRLDPGRNQFIGCEPPSG